MGLEWEQLYKQGTDVAGFALYHPARLAHWNDTPCGWWDEDAAEDEFRAGRLVAFCTGSDGIFTLKFVQRPLSPAEEKALVVSQAFRYLVEDGRLYWDDTNCLPSDDTFEDAEDDPDGWLELPNGRYRFTVHALDWFDGITDAERKAAGDISHYIVQVEPVPSFRGVPVPKSAPWLQASREWHAEWVKKQRGRRKSAPKKVTTEPADPVGEVPRPLKAILDEIAGEIFKSVKTSNETPNNWQRAILDVRWVPSGSMYKSVAKIQDREGKKLLEMVASHPTKDLMREIHLRRRAVREPWYGLQIAVDRKGKYKVSYNEDAHCAAADDFHE